MDMRTFNTKAAARAFRAFAKDHSDVKATKMIALADCFLVIVFTF